MADYTIGSTVDAAMQRAARDLPDDYVITVYVEKGAAWVECLHRGENVELESSTDLSLTEEIDHAVAAAVEHDKRAGNV